MKKGITPAPLFYQALQATKNSTVLCSQGLDSTIGLGPVQREELLWWQKQANNWNGASLSAPDELMKIQTDDRRLSGQKNRRPLVYGRSELPHKLPGTARHILVNPDFCYKKAQHDCVDTDGQRDSYVIRQQEGGDITDKFGNFVMEVVHGREDNFDSRTPPRSFEHHRRSRVSSHERSLGLEIEPSNFRPARHNIWATGDRSVCLQDVHSTSTILQLETRPASTVDGCIYSDMEGQSVCQPPMGLVTTGPVGNQESEGQHHIGGTSLEVTELVPNAISLALLVQDAVVDTVVQLHQLPLPIKGSEVLSDSCQTESYQQKLQNFSWHHGDQNRNPPCDSLFRRWECWCNQRNRVQFMVLSVTLPTS